MNEVNIRILRLDGVVPVQAPAPVVEQQYNSLPFINSPQYETIMETPFKPNPHLVLSKNFGTKPIYSYVHDYYRPHGDRKNHHLIPLLI